MKHFRKGIWFPISLGILTFTIALWTPFSYGETYLLNRSLLNRGVVEYAQIVKRGILVEDELVWSELPQKSEDHQFRVKLSNPEGENICQFGVSESLYKHHPLGSGISVTYLPEKPQRCKTTSNIPGIQKIITYGLGLSALMMMLAFGSSFFVFRSYRISGPGDSSKLTTEMKLEEGMRCPKCSVNMTEGYLPMGGGIVWRKIDQPVGIPTIFSGLPGTASWRKRPKLHAFHCENCNIVSFMYGKK